MVAYWLAKIVEVAGGSERVVGVAYWLTKIVEVAGGSERVVGGYILADKNCRGGWCMCILLLQQ